MVTCSKLRLGSGAAVKEEYAAALRGPKSCCRLFSGRIDCGVEAITPARPLAPAIAGALHRVRGIVARAESFDPATSSRRMVIGAPDGVSAVFLPSLMSAIGTDAPGLSIGIRQLLPLADEMSPERAWRDAFRELETRALDVAIIPVDEGPLRFERRTLYEEDFVLVLRMGHPLLDRQSVDAYCESGHLVVSHSGDPRGFVDELLSSQGLARRVALTVPNFIFACAVVGETDLICAVPRRFAARYATRLGIAVVEPPLPLGHFRLNAFIPRSALSDAGLLWVLDRLATAGAEAARAVEHR